MADALAGSARGKRDEIGHGKVFQGARREKGAPLGAPAIT
jgi:hypothetical protein